jgi:2',3'-cyclic-nucleotide 2'-phosphodiesterase
MKILFIGDIVARPGRNAVTKVLPKLLGDGNIDLVVANAENIAHGRGATVDIINEMRNIGIDYFTGGDHIFWQKGFDRYIDELPVLRPVNYPESVPGRGHVLVDANGKGKVLLMNAMGRTFLNERLDDPFSAVDTILEENSDCDFSLVDFHAEATSEKHALAFYLDGRVDAVVGTHTHVPTSDTRTLPNGTLYVTDVGMTGNIDSVLGVKKELIINMYTTARNQRFEWEEQGNSAFRSVLINTEDRSIVRVDEDIQ